MRGLKMPKQVVRLAPTGLINRRDKADEGNYNQVLTRENFMVIGTGDDKYSKKISGSDRLTPNANSLQSLSLLDASASLHAITANGSAATQSTISEIGLGALSLNGTTDFLSLLDSSDWNFGAGDFTVDFWVYINPTFDIANGASIFYSQRESSLKSIVLVISDGQLSITVNNGAPLTVSIKTSSAVINTGTFYHIAFVRSGTTGKIFLNGISQTITVVTSDFGATTIIDFNALLKIGCGGPNGSESNFVNGYIDEFRISNVARWTSDFTPQTTPYTSDTNTVLLIHFDTANPVGQYVCGYRYYTKGAFRKTFAYNSNGSLVFIDDLGNTTALLTAFDPTAIPCFEEMRVSGNDNLYFSEGTNTGMYSYDGNDNNQFNKEPSVSLNFVRMVSFLNRMWGFEEDSDIVNVSVNLNPVNYTDATDAIAISIGPKRGSKLQNIVIFNETLYFIKNDSIFALQGNTPSNFSIVEVHPYLGTAARYSVCRAENSLMFLGSDYEFYSFQGTLASTQLQSYQIAISGDFTKDLVPIINRDNMKQVRACFHDHIYRCAFNENGYSSGGMTINNLEWCLNLTNQTDFITRDNNVSCYIIWDRIPDQQQLITGRSDTGLLMFQYRGLNWDNQASSPTMPINLLTKFWSLKQPRNFRAKKAWLNNVVLGAQPIQIGYFLDTRLALSSAQDPFYTTQGEVKKMTNFIRINNQRTITSRNILTHDGANGQSIAFFVNQNTNNTDFGFSSIDFQIITRELKRNEKVSI